MKITFYELDFLLEASSLMSISVTKFTSNDLLPRTKKNVRIIQEMSKATVRRKKLCPTNFGCY